MQKFILNLTNEGNALIVDSDIECFIAPTEAGENSLKAWLDEARRHNKILLLSGQDCCAMCQKLGADGVLVDLSASEHCAKDVNFARKQIGDKVLGVISRNRRHEAMLISECEPDFVAFKVWQQGKERASELVSWYTEMFLIQSAAVLQEPISDLQTLDCDIVVGNASDYKIFVAKK